MTSPRMGWPDPPLHDDRLALRPWRDDDAEALVAAWYDPAIVAMGSVPPMPTIDYARHWIGGADQRAAAGIALDLVITHPAGTETDRDVLGEVGATLAPGRGDQAEVGYWIAAAHRNHGLASAAVKLFVDWLVAPDGGGLRRVAAQVSADNVASIRVLSHAGFGYQGDAEGDTRIYLRQGTENLRL